MLEITSVLAVIVWVNVWSSWLSMLSSYFWFRTFIYVGFFTVLLFETLQTSSPIVAVHFAVCSSCPFW